MPAPNFTATHIIVLNALIQDEKTYSYTDYCKHVNGKNEQVNKMHLIFSQTFRIAKI